MASRRGHFSGVARFVMGRFILSLVYCHTRRCWFNRRSPYDDRIRISVGARGAARGPIVQWITKAIGLYLLERLITRVTIDIC